MACKVGGAKPARPILRAFLARRASGLLVWQADPHFSLFQCGVVHNYPNKLASTTRQVPILWLRHINFPPLERLERPVCATRLTTTKDAVYSSLILCIFSNLFVVFKRGDSPSIYYCNTQSKCSLAFRLFKSYARHFCTRYEM